MLKRWKIMRTKYVTTKLSNGQKIYQVDHPCCTATISEFGGQLLSFQDQQGEEWLWLSKSAIKDGSKAIRGGVPICWPWFGPNDDKTLPQHGYARLVNWALVSVEEDEFGVRLTLQPDFVNSKYEIYNLSLFMKIDLGTSLSIQLHTENISNFSVSFSQAIHTYLAVDDIKECSISGLNGCVYLDQLKNKISHQENDLVLSQWTDSIYSNVQNPLTLAHNGKTSKVIDGNGHDSVVIWNPWQDGARLLSDFDDLGYQNMICIEMANTATKTLAPRQSHTLTQIISIPKS